MCMFFRKMFGESITGVALAVILIMVGVVFGKVFKNYIGRYLAWVSMLNMIRITSAHFKIRRN